MISAPVLKYGVKTNLSLVSIFAALVGSMILSLAWLFPSLSTNASFTGMVGALPPELRDALGVVSDQSEYFGFLSANYYNSLHIMFLMAFVVLLVYRLASVPIDTTSLGYFLSGRTSRVSYLMTQILVFVGALLVVTVSSVLFAALGHLMFAEGNIEWEGILTLNLLLFAIFIPLGAVCFLIRMMTKAGTTALAWSASLVVVEYFIHIARSLAPDVTWLRYTTVFTLFDVEKFRDDPGALTVTVIALVAAAIVIGLCSLLLFRKKDLNL